MKAKKNIMVCVTKQKTCERLIKRGVKIKEQKGGSLFVVHVAPTGWNFLGNSKEGEALDYLFEISKSVGADMTVLRSSKVVDSIVEFCKNNSIATVVLGKSPEVAEDDNIILKLGKILEPEVELEVVATT